MKRHPGPLIRQLLRFAGDRSGTAVTEFALSLPLLMTAGLGGVELTNRAIVQMQVNQLAVQIADNASRIGDTSTLDDRKIYESDMTDIFKGADIQAGKGIDLFEHGRVTISSLEVVPDTEDSQYIHWQRCKGKKPQASSYGIAGDGLDGSMTGMGPGDEQVYAIKFEAVMFVEVAYDYQPLVGGIFTPDQQVTATASFYVRNDRDLSQIYQRDQENPDTVARCSTFDSFKAIEG